MPAYHQMGHHSNNLIDLPEMSRFKGAIFSPINEAEDEIVEQISAVVESRGADFDVILDPQLYIPATQRGRLKEWSYFPKDVDTADTSSLRWWRSVNSKLAKSVVKLPAQGVCSPVIIPKVFNDGFYAASVGIATDLSEKLADSNCRVLQTVLVNATDLSEADRSYQLASIISKTECEQIYLVVLTDVEPRRELSDADEIVGAMRLIKLLEDSHLPVMVGFCSSDVILWKAAGATDCASGKFFNLRRFTKERFEEPTGTGGGQLPYWFEESLLAFLREQDLLRVRQAGFLSTASNRNPFCKEILAGLDEAKRTRMPFKWVGLGWRQFLYWFADVENRLDKGPASSEELLNCADETWARLEKSKLKLIERPNDGYWIRTWLNSIALLET